MGTAALTSRLPAFARARASAEVSGLAFDELNGPLVAVCGLTGGSGASTLALSLAEEAARESSAPVLLTESGTASAALVEFAGRTRYGLDQLAAVAAAGDLHEHPFIEAVSGLRIITAGPQTAAPASPDDLAALLADARAAHGLVVVDCTRGWPSTDVVLREATHILWTMPARLRAIEHTRMVFRSGTLPPRGSRPEALVAASVDQTRSVRLRDLRRLARERCDRLVLVPHSDEVGRGDSAICGFEASTALAGLVRVLRQPL